VKALLDEDEVNVPMTPMIDVVFQLLIFFLLATTVKEEELDLHIRLAAGDQGAARAASAGTHLVIGVRKDGSLTLSGMPIEMADLRKRLEAVGRARQKPQVFVRGDREAPHGRVALVYQVCVRSGLQDVKVPYTFEPGVTGP
jgi:biopolymer transport protein ExbD